MINKKKYLIILSIFIIIGIILAIYKNDYIYYISGSLVFGSTTAFALSKLKSNKDDNKK